MSHGICTAEGWLDNVKATKWIEVPTKFLFIKTNFFSTFFFLDKFRVKNVNY